MKTDTSSIRTKTMDMTKEEILDVPRIKYDPGSGTHDTGRYDTIIIVPEGGVHDSGYGTMTFVMTLDGVPVGKIGGGADSIQLPPEAKQWHLDCLPKSGLIQLWPKGASVKIVTAQSVFVAVPAQWSHTQ